MRYINYVKPPADLIAFLAYAGRHNRNGDYYMYNANYFVKSKGIPFVSYRATLESAGKKTIFTHMHYHTDFEIIIIQKGSAVFEINSETFSAKEGSIVLINPYDTHFSYTESEFFSYVCLDFDVKLLSLPNESELLREKIKYRALPDAGNELITYLLNAVSSFEETPKGWELAVRGNLILFFSFIGDCVYPFRMKDDFPKKALSFIDENLSSPITSAHAAKALSYNPSYFCRLFKKNFAYDFSTFLNMRRIEKAKELLLHTSVSETAMQCGFCSTSYFSEIFKKNTSFTPTQFKKRLSAS